MFRSRFSQVFDSVLSLCIIFNVISQSKLYRITGPDIWNTTIYQKPPHPPTANRDYKRIILEGCSWDYSSWSTLTSAFTKSPVASLSNEIGEISWTCVLHYICVHVFCNLFQHLSWCLFKLDKPTSLMQFSCYLLNKYSFKYSRQSNTVHIQYLLLTMEHSQHWFLPDSCFLFFPSSSFLLESQEDP